MLPTWKIGEWLANCFESSRRRESVAGSIPVSSARSNLGSDEGQYLIDKTQHRKEALKVRVKSVSPVWFSWLEHPRVTGEIAGSSPATGASI